MKQQQSRSRWRGHIRLSVMPPLLAALSLLGSLTAPGPTGVAAMDLGPPTPWSGPSLATQRTLFGLGGMGALASAFAMLAIYLLRFSPVVRAFSLCCTLTTGAGLMFGFVGAALQGVHPVSSLSCRAGAALAHAAFLLVFGSLVMRSYRTTTLFREHNFRSSGNADGTTEAVDPSRTRITIVSLSPSRLLALALACLALLGLYLGLWFGLFDGGQAGPLVVGSDMFVVCNLHGSAWAWSLLGLEAATLLLCVYLALQIRGISVAQRFNESTFTSVVTYVTVIVASVAVGLSSSALSLPPTSTPLVGGSMLSVLYATLVLLMLAPLGNAYLLYKYDPSSRQATHRGTGIALPSPALLLMDAASAASYIAREAQRREEADKENNMPAGAYRIEMTAADTAGGVGGPFVRVHLAPGRVGAHLSSGATGAAGAGTGAGTHLVPGASASAALKRMLLSPSTPREGEGRMISFGDSAVQEEDDTDDEQSAYGPGSGQGSGYRASHPHVHMSPLAHWQQSPPPPPPPPQQQQQHAHVSSLGEDMRRFSYSDDDDDGGSNSNRGGNGNGTRGGRAAPAGSAAGSIAQPEQESVTEAVTPGAASTPRRLPILTPQQASSGRLQLSCNMVPSPSSLRRPMPLPGCVLSERGRDRDRDRERGGDRGRGRDREQYRDRDDSDLRADGDVEVDRRLNRNRSLRRSHGSGDFVPTDGGDASPDADADADADGATRPTAAPSPGDTPSFGPFPRHHSRDSN